MKKALNPDFFSFLVLTGFATSLRLRRGVSLMMSTVSVTGVGVSGRTCSSFFSAVLQETATLVGVSLYSLSTLLGLTEPGPGLGPLSLAGEAGTS